jgi:hypothetical protein
MSLEDQPLAVEASNMKVASSDDCPVLNLAHRKFTQMLRLRKLTQAGLTHEADSEEFHVLA